MNNAMPIETGWTYYGRAGTINTSDYGNSVDLEGREVQFQDSTTKQMRYGRLMRNTSGITMYGGKTVTNVATTYRNRRFDGYGVTSAGLPVVGVIDPGLATIGVRNGDICIVFYKGPCQMKLNENPGEVVAAGDWAIAMTGATSQATTGAGKVLLTAAANTTPTRTIGVFMEAATTLHCTAGTMKLVDLDINGR
jgi:hypothetical protein